MDKERVELEDDIKKLQHTLEEDKNQWQYDYIVDSDDDDSEDEDDALYIDLDKQGSAAASVTSFSARSVGGRSHSSAQSTASQGTSAVETQSLTTEQDEDGGELFREVGVMQEELDSSTLARLPVSLESCLALNRAYQDVMAEHITRIELEIAENREAQKHIEEELKESGLKEITKKRFPYNATLPYFKMKFGSTPAQNEDTRLKRLTDEPDLDKRPEKTWHGRQKQTLRDAVIDDAREKLIQPLLSRRELEEGKLASVGEKTEECRQILDRINAIDQQIQEKSKTPAEVLLQYVDAEKVDWMKISNMTFEGKRDWMACRRAWEHSIDPRLNQGEMTEAEEERLIQLVRQTNGTNWVYIAQQMGTGRTPFQCLQYFQQNLNKDMDEKPWTDEEDEQLIKVVEKCKHYHFNWRKVSHYMEGRSGIQCYKRFSKLDPNIKTGHWSETEDAQLITAVQLLGTQNWGRVKELVPGRTREQCRERYLNSLDPSISGKRWSYEEDKKLLKLVLQHGKGNWVKCVKELPGRTDNQALQRYRRLEDWRKKTEWFTKQSEQDRNLLQGNNLTGVQKERTQNRNWDEFRDKFGVLPEDYIKQRRDMESGDIVVPRPPFMIGLANKTGCKVWERRIKLHKLIETHIDKLKDKYNFMHPSVSGVFELQDAISQLSRDCITQRDALMNKRKDRLGQLIHGLPSVISVKDLLTVSRGGKIPEKRQRGSKPNKKKKAGTIPPRLLQSMRVDTELRTIVRANLKDRSLKKGRPRRFFWDISGDQVLDDEEIGELKATSFSLYLKSLGADLGELLQSGRRSFPQLFHKLQQQQLSANSTKPEPGTSQSPSTSDGKQAGLRRSQRQSKMQEAENAANSDPFSLSGLPLNTVGFSEWQKQRDYELLEWLAKQQGVSVDDQLSEGVSQSHDIPSTAASAEVSESAATSPSMPQGTQRGSQPLIGQGMSLVTARIQRALEEQAEKKRREEAAAAGERGAGQGTQNDLAVHHHHQQQQERQTAAGGEVTRATTSGVGVGGAGVRGSAVGTLPSLPPTNTSLHCFTHLMLDRLKLIKKAGGYYHLPYYQVKKDKQVASLIQSGAKLQEMNRGTIDLNRMMNRVSQETNFNQRKKRRTKNSDPVGEQNSEAESKNFDFRVLETVRQTPEFQTLQSRFLSVFTWPSLLSAIYPPFQRKEYREKAGGQSYLRPEDGPSFQNVRKMLPLLKTKAFYRYANKTKQKKEEMAKKLEERRILQQVKQLLADEDDPDPKVTYEPDSENENESSQQPGPDRPSNKRSREEEKEGEDVDNPATDDEKQQQEPSSPPKKKTRRAYRKRNPNAQPVRQSERVTERKVYVDSINQKRSLGPRKKPGERMLGVSQQYKMRPNRLHPSIRIAMIDAIVENSRKSPRRQGTDVTEWNPGGYVSDDGEDDRGNDMETELRQGGDWMGELPSELQDNLALLERESIVESETVVVRDGGGGGSSGSNNSGGNDNSGNSTNNSRNSAPSAVTATTTASSSSSSVGEVSAQGGGSHVTRNSQSATSSKRYVPEVVVLRSENDDDDDDGDGGDESGDNMDDDGDGPSVASLLAAKRAGKGC